MLTHCASETALSSLHGRAQTCQPRPPTSSRSSRVRARVHATARSLSGGGAARALAACARRVALVGVAHVLYNRTAPSRRPFFSVHGRAPTCQPRPPTSRRRMLLRTRERVPARSLAGGGAPRALAACARHTALIGAGMFSMTTHCVSRTALSLVARSCSDVPAAASNEQSAFACAHTQVRHRVCSLSREMSQHARLRRARAAPR